MAELNEDLLRLCDQEREVAREEGFQELKMPEQVQAGRGKILNFKSLKSKVISKKKKLSFSNRWEILWKAGGQVLRG